MYNPYCLQVRTNSYKTPDQLWSGNGTYGLYITGCFDSGAQFLVHPQNLKYYMYVAFEGRVTIHTQALIDLIDTYQYDRSPAVLLKYTHKLFTELEHLYGTPVPTPGCEEVVNTEPAIPPAVPIPTVPLEPVLPEVPVLPPLLFSFTPGEGLEVIMPYVVTSDQATPQESSFAWVNGEEAPVALTRPSFPVIGEVAYYALPQSAGEIYLDNTQATGTLVLGDGLVNLTVLSLTNTKLTLELGDWVNNGGRTILLGQDIPDYSLLATNTREILDKSGPDVIIERILDLGELDIVFQNPVHTALVADMNALRLLGWQVLPSTQEEAFTFTTQTNGTISPSITAPLSNIITWVVDGVTYIGDSPDISVTAGTIVTVLVDENEHVEGINIDNCGVAGELYLTALPALVDFSCRNAAVPTFKFSPQALAQPVIQEYDLAGSVDPYTNLLPVLSSWVIANGGSVSSTGNFYNGGVGNTVVDRQVSLALGTLIAQTKEEDQDIAYQIYTLLNTLPDMTVTDLVATCRKAIEFYIVDGVPNADYEIGKDFRNLAASPVNEIDFIDGDTDYSDIVSNTAEFELLDANKAALSPAVNNLSAIDNYLLNNDCTGFYLRCTATAVTGKVGIATLSYFDLPDATKACGHVDKAGWPNFDIWVDFQDASTVTASGNTLQSVTDKSGNNWLFESTSTGPRVFGDFVRFDNQLNSLVYNGAKSNFNFLHDGTVDYAIVLAVDLSASTGNNKVNQIFGTEGNYTSANVGLSLNSEQRVNSTKGIRIAISTGVNGAFAYNLLGVNIVNEMAIYTFNIPINSAGTLEVFVNKTLAGSSSRLNPPTLNDSTVNATIGVVRRPSISALMDLADLVILKSPTAVQIAAWEEVLAYKNGITL